MNPQQHQKFLGQTFVNRLTRDIVFTFGGETYSRHFCVTQLKCGNFRALRLLEQALKDLGCKKLDDILSIDPIAIASIKGVGETTLYGLLCYIESKGKNAKIWYTPHAADAKQVTFHSMKVHALSVGAKRTKQGRRMLRTRKAKLDVAAATIN